MSGQFLVIIITHIFNVRNRCVMLVAPVCTFREGGCFVYSTGTNPPHILCNTSVMHVTPVCTFRDHGCFVYMCVHTCTLASTYCTNV